MASLVETRIAERAMFLQAAYESVNGRALVFFDAKEIALQAGVPEKEATLFVIEMSRRGHIENLSNDNQASLSEFAIDAVEELATLESPPPSVSEWQTIINSPENCNINIGSSVIESKQTVAAARDHWIKTVGKLGIDIARGYFTA